MKTIQEKNKAIAEFMGNYRFFDLSNVLKDGSDQQKKMWAYNLSYERDWRSIMMVVEKIEKMGHEVNIRCNYCSIMSLPKEDLSMEGLVMHEADTKIKAIYKCVHEFITKHHQS